MRDASVDEGRLGAAVATISAVWADVLGADGVAVDVGFFDLGADSLQMIQALGLLRAEWPSIRIVDLFSHPTVSALARHLVSTR
jgi:nonribosomal peptide synthetase DhbF